MEFNRSSARFERSFVGTNGGFSILFDGINENNSLVKTQTMFVRIGGENARRRFSDCESSRRRVRLS
jgi:hypothetical protein